MTGTLSGIVGGALFGGDMPLAVDEQALGRNLAIVRDYYYMHSVGAPQAVAGGGQYPTPIDARLMSQGTTLLVSLDTPPGGPTYGEIAAGQEDQSILTFLQAVNASAVQNHLSAIYVDFEHEADDAGHHLGLGSTTQFIQAWDHIHQLAVSAGLDWQQGGRLHWVLILMHTSYYSGLASSFWPGNGEVDVVAADGYNKGGCARARGSGSHFTTGRTPMETPASLFDTTVQFAHAHGGLPVFIAEWGSVPYQAPAVRPDFITLMQSFVAVNPEVAGALYWDSDLTPCDYNVNNSPLSFKALTTMADSSVMQGQVAPLK